jgi:hypothetical protein
VAWLYTCPSVRQTVQATGPPLDVHLGGISGNSSDRPKPVASTSRCADESSISDLGFLLFGLSSMTTGGFVVRRLPRFALRPTLFRGTVSLRSVIHL